MALTAQVDTNDAARIIFSEPITIQQATTYLWARPPARADAIRPDPAERAIGGRQKRYLINKNDFDLVFSLQHRLADVYVRRIRPIMSRAPAELPQWVPRHIRDAILNGRVPDGVRRFPGTSPWGDIIVWINRSGGYMSIQVYQEFPQSLNYYLGITGGGEREARLLHQVYTQFNKDMSHFVEKRGLSPEMARSEIQRINDEVFKLIIEASIAMLSSGAGISAANNAIRASSRQVIDTAERTGFARVRGMQSTSTQAVEEIRMSQAEYRAALRQVFPGQYLDAVARMIDEIGQRAAQRVVNNPQFVQAIQSGNWKLAGTLFHSTAAQEARAVSASALPRGWILRAEQVIQSGAGGSRADILLQGPTGQIIEFDWKTTGRSGLSSATRNEMRRHAGQITVNIGGTLTKQESRSWVDYVRPLLPGVSWP